MASIKTPNNFAELTAKNTSDLICIWDVDEVADEKIKRMTLANFFAGCTLTGTTSMTGEVNITGDTTVGSATDFVEIDNDGHIELCNTGGVARIDFKNLNTDDYDCRIIQVSNGLELVTGGQSSQVLGLSIDSSQTVNCPVSLKAPEKLVIPQDQPSSLENGCIWIA